MIKVIEINTKKDIKKFVKFPIDLYKNNKYYVPTLINDEMDNLNPNKNHAYKYCETKLFLAYKDNKIVGRICGLINHKYNEMHNAKIIRFNRFDVIDDIEVTKALIKAVEDYGKVNALNEIIGPMGFSDQDKEGMLIEDFDQVSMYITYYNHPYYVEHMQKLGFVKEVDWVEYKVSVPQEMDPRIDKIANMVLKRRELKLIKFKHKKDITPYVTRAFHLINDAFAPLFGYVPISEEQMKTLESQFLLLINPSFDIIRKLGIAVTAGVNISVFTTKLNILSLILNFFFSRT